MQKSFRYTVTVANGSAEVRGTTGARGHYFENGNIQLQTSKELTAKRVSFMVRSRPHVLRVIIFVAVRSGLIGRQGVPIIINRLCCLVDRTLRTHLLTQRGSVVVPCRVARWLLVART